MKGNLIFVQMKNLQMKRERISKRYKEGKYTGICEQYRSKTLLYKIIIFTNNYKTDDLNNSIVLISCCCFYGDNNKEDYSFANAFRKIGVESVVGFCNSVGQTYAECFMEKLLVFYLKDI